MPQNRPLLITGMPRSGATSVMALADHQPDSVALNEPRWQLDWAEANQSTSGAEDFTRWLIGDCAVIRQQLLDGIALPDRRLADGAPLISEESPSAQASLFSLARPGLTPDFHLTIKHNGLYLSALRQLAESRQFTIVAIIRHPAAVLASWNEVPIPLDAGKMPGAVYWPNMRMLADAQMDLLKKQVLIYDLVCKRLASLRHLIHIIRYEDMVQDSSVLNPVFGYAPMLPMELSMSGNHIFSEPNTDDFYARAVRRLGEYYRQFYPDV